MWLDDELCERQRGRHVERIAICRASAWVESDSCHGINRNLKINFCKLNATFLLTNVTREGISPIARARTTTWAAKDENPNLHIYRNVFHGKCTIFGKHATGRSKIRERKHATS
ncbi:hypothetical protein PUN28_017424 [Cardiocondyla obscurior]|uniref:Uncharacterized protein n=1 Tax=Cardiocondyla obscurior TaxID=286306 RepID=A0AAW2ELR1_9HYME